MNIMDENTLQKIRKHSSRLIALGFFLLMVGYNFSQNVIGLVMFLVGIILLPISALIFIIRPKTIEEKRRHAIDMNYVSGIMKAEREQKKQEEERQKKKEEHLRNIEEEEEARERGRQRARRY